MKISLAWLRERVDLNGISDQQLMDGLTAAGLEIEDVQALGRGLEHVVVGKIVALSPHPNADKLRVCQVDIGQLEKLQIVCGAANAALGLMAPVALVGASLPNGLNIKASALRGVDSHGMLCSAAELGLDSDASGLMELEATLKLGESLATALALEDQVIEIKITPNRSDCLSARGLARELSAVFKRDLKEASIASFEVGAEHGPKIALNAGAACPRYLGQAIVGLNSNAKTPAWMREKLRRSGLRSIHPLVDITNFVLLETGQPMHAFDLDAIDGDIEVRNARAGEQLIMLDQREVALDEQFLVIADAKGALAAAGVMGGFASRVHEGTKSVFFESAHFAPAAIMGRARKLGLSTDASYRFERGVDPEAPEQALKLAVSLALEIMGGEAKQVRRSDRLAELPKPATIRLRHARLEALIGMTVGRAEVFDKLSALGCQLDRDGDDWLVRVPSARFDLAIEEDLVEEVARLVGYDAICKAPLRIGVGPRIESELRLSDQVLRQRIAARDYHEAITFAFQSESELHKYGVAEQGFRLLNPLSSDLAVMRPSLLPGLVQVAIANLRRQLSRVRMFEIGRVFLDAGTRETSRFAMVAIGSAEREQWGTNARALDFFDFKGDLESLIARDFSMKPAHQSYLHPGRSAEIWLDGAPVGSFGQLHPRLNQVLDCREAIFVAELELDALAHSPLPLMRELSKFPATRRDLALVVSNEFSVQELDVCLGGLKLPFLRNWLIFDEFRGKGLPENSRSIAIGLIFQEESRTLRDEEVDAGVADCVAALRSQLKAELRS